MRGTPNGSLTWSGNFTANNGKDGAFNITTHPYAGSTLIRSLASDGTEGAYIALCNKSDTAEAWKGAFRLSTSQNGTDLVGFTSGSLQWCGKNVISSNAAPGVLSFPSTSGINYSSRVSSGAGDILVKAPADGWFMLNAYCQSGTKFRCAIYSINLGVEVMTGDSGFHTAICPIKKDEYVALCVTGTGINCMFFPCEGNV